jgi:hypothetical protein
VISEIPERKSQVLEFLEASASMDQLKVEAEKCLKAYARTLAKGEYMDHEAKGAYKRAMPLMVDMESIRGFISCVAQGMLLGVFSGSEASKLLYAAQVELSTLKGQKGQSDEREEETEA